MMEGMMTDPQRKLLFSKMQEGNVSKEDLEKSLGFGISELSKGDYVEVTVNKIIRYESEVTA